MIDKGLLEIKVVSVLKTCFDPEIPVDIYELGLIYLLKVDEEGNVYIKMTLTSPSCPVADRLPGEIKEKIKSIKEVNDVYIDLVWEPAWNMDMMTEEAKLTLGLF
jgi:FeS assembly SUF system protein